MFRSRALFFALIGTLYFTQISWAANECKDDTRVARMAMCACWP